MRELAKNSNIEVWMDHLHGITVAPNCLAPTSRWDLLESALYFLFLRVPGGFFSY